MIATDGFLTDGKLPFPARLSVRKIFVPETPPVVYCLLHCKKRPGELLRHGDVF
jgi:hypothetical protein